MAPFKTPRESVIEQLFTGLGTVQKESTRDNESHRLETTGNTSKFGKRSNYPRASQEIEIPKFAI